MIYNPVSTYRIQLSKNFSFRNLVEIIPYLNRLGIRTIYASPILEAVPGSTHCYDVTNPLSLNPEIGSLEEFRTVHDILQSLGMGWIQDIVPNHMAYSTHNPWIFDIMEQGKNSKYSGYFDIDWDHPDPELTGKILLPFLSDDPERLIDEGKISTGWNGTFLFLGYLDYEFPLNSDSYTWILEQQDLDAVTNPRDEMREYFRAGNINQPDFRKGKEILAEKFRTDKIFAGFLSRRLTEVNQDKKALKDLIRHQHYVPVCWRESDRRINYRRFCTINSLISLRMELPEVFSSYHSLLAVLFRENLIQGVRVDHVDGLCDPSGYLEQLRGVAGDDSYIIVEKILQKSENLKTSLPVQGETGYHFLSALSDLFTNRSGTEVLAKTYKQWNEPAQQDFPEVLYEKKHYILHSMMAGDLDNLAACFLKSGLAIVPIQDREKMKMAIGEFLLRCPVYRICGTPGNFSAQEIKLLRGIFENALSGSPALSKELRLLRRIILSISPADSGKAKAFFRRCMQYSGPLMAKGGEDTAFYTFNRFIARNEVGDSPDSKGSPVNEFHAFMTLRRKNEPMSLNTLTTHDTKRGEDARARLLVLSDIPSEWTEKVREWHRSALAYKQRSRDPEIPSLNVEYFIYQTLAGFMPSGQPAGGKFEERLYKYMIKALREGKEHSGWSDPDKTYETLTTDFIRDIISPESEFLTGFLPFLEKVDYLGRINSLSQLILKFMLPGTPDIYQGCETWNFSFVDPDNRRPVDFRDLSDRLDRILEGKLKFSDLYIDKFDEDLKILLTHVLLKCRNENPGLFEKGEYIPLKIKGARAQGVLAFCRRYGETVLITVLPLHPGSFFDNPAEPGMNSIDWTGCHIELPEFFPERYENLLTGEDVTYEKLIDAQELFSTVPFGLLKGKREGSRRQAGVLLHISSLPGNYPAGNFGPEAYRFADLLKRSGQSFWQILPLNQTDGGQAYSPYSPLSAFAGNISFISPDLLLEQGLVRNIPSYPKPANRCRSDFRQAEKRINEVITNSFGNFRKKPPGPIQNNLEKFRESEKYWLMDYALFRVLKTRFSNSVWSGWPDQFRDHDEEALEKFYRDNKEIADREVFAQFIFQEQWEKLKGYCNDLGIMIFGDLPIYVNYDSADVWAHPGLFSLKKNKRKAYVAGVPPDYFSKSGQLWNMPTFRWDAMKQEGYSWWKNRIRRNLELCDLIRLDHFRGFSAFWEVPAEEKTAVNGKWKKGPGKTFFDEICKEFPQMPFVAEDLGDIDKEVYKLRDRYGMPGMKVLQFAFGRDSGTSVHSLHNHTFNSIVYTGTHDNNTIRGWFRKEAGKTRKRNLNAYTGQKITEVNCSTEVVRLAYSSVARLVVIPVQDILGMGEEARMNTPSAVKGSWTWRLNNSAQDPRAWREIAEFTEIFGRY